MSFIIDNNYPFYGQCMPSINFLSEDTNLTNPYSGHLFLYNKKTSSHLVLTLPTTSDFIGTSLIFKNPNLYYNIQSTTNNIKQIDGTVSNLICGSDNFSNIIFDGTNWLVAITN